MAPNMSLTTASPHFGPTMPHREGALGLPQGQHRAPLYPIQGRCMRARGPLTICAVSGPHSLSGPHNGLTPPVQAAQQQARRGIAGGVPAALAGPSPRHVQATPPQMPQRGPDPTRGGLLQPQTRAGPHLGPGGTQSNSRGTRSSRHTHKHPHTHTNTHTMNADEQA